MILNKNQQNRDLYSDSKTSTVTQTKSKAKIKKPSMYRVILLNDDYTPMEFVVWLLQHVFFLNEQLSNQLMLKVHTEGRGICGVFSYDIAQTKQAQVKQHAEKNEHPLECIIEPDDETS